MQRFTKTTGLLVAIFFIQSFCFAQDGIGFKGIGGKLGFISPEAIGSTIGFGVFADLGNITPNIQLAANAGYWSKSTSSVSSFRDLSLGAVGQYFFAVSNKLVRPFAEAGLAFHGLKSETEDADFFGQQQNFTVTNNKIGVDLGGGVLYQLSPQLDLLGQVKYRIVSNFNQLNINAGLLYRLGK